MKLNSLTFFACLMILLSAASCSKKERIELETITVGFGEVCESVTSTGTLESVTQVDVGTQVTGIISKLYADYNSVVKAGDLIAEIDKTTLESELKAADANLESAKLTYEYTKKNYERDLALHDKQLISDYEFDTTRKDYLIAKSSYEKSKSDRVKAARNLSYAEIYAPIDGIVISREVEVGQTVVSNMSVANLFTIADLNNLQVVADVDEADIGSVKVGQNATFTVDAYPNDVFSGKVTQVRINPTTTSNVVTYEVLIDAANPDMKLIPGLTANITINTKEARNVLAIPLKALKFMPQEFEGADNLPSFDEMPTPPHGAPAHAESDKPKDPAIPTDDPQRLVWVLSNGKLKPTEIELGIDNGIDVVVVNGLSEGDVVAQNYTSAMPQEAQQQGVGESNPFMPKPPQRKSNKK